MNLIVKVLLMALVAIVVTTPKAQQSPVSSSQSLPTAGSPTAMPMPRQGVSSDMEKSLEAQKVAWAAYQMCIRENKQAFELYQTTNSLISIRETKEKLKSDPVLQVLAAQKGLDILAEEAKVMPAYRQAGGVATSLDQIEPMKNPCIHVSPGPKPREKREGRSSISASTSVTAIPTEALPEPSATQGIPVGGTSDGAIWSKISESSASVIYVDPSSIRKVPRTEKSDKDEDIRQATEMTDFKIKAPGGPSSYVATGEYDCKNGKIRYRSGNAYAGRAGTGRTLDAISPSGWSPQPPNSLGIPILKYVCSKDLSLTSATAASE